MTKMEYEREVANKVNGEVKEVEKANGVKFIGICKRLEGDENISPTVYIDYSYEHEYSVDEAAAEISRIFEKNKLEADVKWIEDYEKVKPLLRAKLFNKSTSAEVYISAEKWGFSDLIIVPYIEGIIKSPDPDSIASCKVNEWMLQKWGMFGYEVIEDALENCKGDIVVEDLGTMLARMMGFDGAVPELGAEMTVVTNAKRMGGAIGILFKLDEFREKYPEGFTVLPSSLHEVIVVSGSNPFFAKMVTEVNAQEVRPEEVLSDHDYYFGKVA